MFPVCSIMWELLRQEAVKGLTAEPPGVLFHHFLEMTTQSRWRIFGILENCRQFSVTTTKKDMRAYNNNPFCNSVRSS